MENENKFCLRLNSFGTDIETTWQQLQNEGNFLDVTLACDDKQIQAHKIVISSISPVLGNILKLNSNPHPFIYLRGVQYKDLVNLVNFMYQGEVSVEEEDLETVNEFITSIDQNILTREENVNDLDQTVLPKNTTIEQKQTMHFTNVRKEVSLNANGPFPCDKCNYSNTLKKHLKSHVITVHEGIHFPCSQCEFTATFKHNLNRHVKKCH